MTKRELWKNYTALKTYINKGDAEISFWSQFFDYAKGAVILTFLKLYWPGLTLKDGIILLLTISVLKVALKIISAVLYKRLGVWKVENEYMAKKEHLNPFNKELVDTLKSICLKIDVSHSFRDL